MALAGRCKAYLTGSFARHERLIKALRNFSKGKISREEYDKVVREFSRKVIEAQVRNKLSYVIDGMLNWGDLFRPIAENTEGIEINGLTRWFDNNLFYKKPIIQGELNRQVNLFDTGYILHDLLKGVIFKVILPEPYTFAKMSENNYYRRFDNMLFALTEIIAEEAYVASARGAEQIQLSAPYLAFKKMSSDDADLVSQALKEIRKKTNKEILLHTYYGPAGNIIEYALDFPVDVIGVDMTLTNFRYLLNVSLTKNICLGVIDGRNTLVEDVDDVVKKILRVIAASGLKEVHIAPNCEFETLPYESAEKKIEVLSAILGRIEEEEVM